MQQNKRDLSRYLKTSYIINWKHPSILNELSKIIEDIPENDDVQKAIKLFYHVRDNFRYKVTFDFTTPNLLKATTTLKQGYGHCVRKAILLTAFGRAAGIPTRLHFVDLKNHLLRPEWIEKLGEKIIYHGYVEFYLNGKWVKASPAYNKELCIRHNYYITDFNGKDDALFKSSDISGNKFMDYIKDHGTFTKVPYIRIFFTWFRYYAPFILKNKRKNRKKLKTQNSKKN